MLALVGVLAVAVAVWLLVLEPGDERVIDDYVLIGPDTLRVATIAGDGAWTRVTEVTETSNEVHLTVKSFAWPLSMADIGQRVEMDVQLAEPLGDRRVTDGFHEIPGGG